MEMTFETRLRVETFFNTEEPIGFDDFKVEAIEEDGEIYVHHVENEDFEKEGMDIPLHVVKQILLNYKNGDIDNLVF